MFVFWGTNFQLIEKINRETSATSIHKNERDEYQHSHEYQCV